MRSSRSSNPTAFAARRIALASDEPTALDAAEVISDLIPRTLEARQATLDELPQGVRLLFGWLQSTGHHVDIGALHRDLPEVGWHDYVAWVGAQLDRLSELCPPLGAIVKKITDRGPAGIPATQPTPSSQAMNAYAVTLMP